MLQIVTFATLNFLSSTFTLFKISTARILEKFYALTVELNFMH